MHICGTRGRRVKGWSTNFLTQEVHTQPVYWQYFSALHGYQCARYLMHIYVLIASSWKYHVDIAFIHTLTFFLLKRTAEIWIYICIWFSTYKWTGFLNFTFKEMSCGRYPHIMKVYTNVRRNKPVSNPCPIHPHCGILTYQWYTLKDFIDSNLLWYPHVLCSNSICDILLYNRQLVVLTS